MTPDAGASGPGYRIGRWLFLRGVGLVYLIAFLSLWVQVEGLIGSKGILPVGDFLQRAQALGDSRFFEVPTLLWVAHGDLALHALCATGVILSALLIVGVAPVPVLVLLWATYLSLVHGGQAFLSFQWDTLLLETGFCALFLAPDTWRPVSATGAPPPTRIGLWLLWLLLFKLMFLSGAVKPLSMDATWWELTALDYHYWTQPIPNGVSWYADRLPAWFQKLSVLVTYLIEIVLPFLIFAGYRGRRAVAVGSVFLMAMISWTGNYGFFNVLTIVLCLPLVDDDAWTRLLPRGALRDGVLPTGAAFAPAGKAAKVAVAALLSLSGLTVVRELARTVPRDADGVAARLADAADRYVLAWGDPLLRGVRPFRTVNGYGLFRAMTTERPEIVLEGSHDGSTWAAYEFPWKPGDPLRRPETVAPHMPRLDWQMWFAALNPRRASAWLTGLMRGVLRGSPPILGLFETNPFPETPPRFVRLVYYRYRFATPEQHRESGAWWSRERSGLLTQPLGREQLGD